MDHGQPKRFPSRQRVEALASGIRLGEIIGDEQAFGHTTGADWRVSLETNSISHAVSTADRERYYQAIGMFFLLLSGNS